MRKLILVILIVCLAGCAGLSAKEAHFVRPPTASKTAQGVQIEFETNMPTDVTLAIVGPDGKIVRHLASGMLGPNAPEPFQKDKLSQRLIWDGKDDRGKPVPSGNYKVKVSLGLEASFDGFIGYNPQITSGIAGLTVDRKGELYVFNVISNIHGGDGTTVCQVFDRKGRYLRTIMPYPANLPEEKLRGLRRLELPDGSKVPFIFQGETRSLYPGVGNIPRQRPLVTRDGRLVFVAIQEYGRYAGAGENRVTVIHTDGGVPAEAVLGPKLADSTRSAASLALSPDEKWLYACGLYDGYAGTYWEKCKWHHVVYRFSWKDKEAKPFLGTLYESGSDEKHLNDPRSIATDPKGNLYVADRGNNRIAVFSAEGKYLGELKVEAPSWVEVHPKTGALYVMTGAPLNQLIKFSGWKEGRELARCTLPNTINHGRRHLWPVMTLDASAEPTVVWVGAPTFYCGFMLLRIEDKGAGFSSPIEVAKLGKAGISIGVVTHLSIDRVRRRLFVKRRTQQAYAETRELLFDTRTGKPIDIKLPKFSGSGPYGSFGADGNFYVYEDYPVAVVKRYDQDMKPFPFAPAVDTIPNLGSPRVHGRGMAVDVQGNVYVLYQKPKEKQSPGDAGDANALNVYGPEGKLKAEHLIDSQVRQIHSVRVDRAGNIYLAAGLRPGKALLPPGLEGRILGLKPYKYGIPPLELNWYPMMYGSIIKFPPTGGVIREGVGGEEANFGFGNPIEVKGALWIHSGASNVPSWRTKGTPDVCLCVPARFDVDDFGRVFYPDVGRFRVGILDTNGNVVLHFGSYGNQDSAGPEIAFAWPQTVAVDDEAVYVGDQINQRIVRVKLSYASERTCEVGL